MQVSKILDKNLTTALNPEGRFIAGKFSLQPPFNYLSATVTCRNSDTVGLTSLMLTQIRSYFVAFDRFETW